ncbi:tRNA (guanine(10)-N(2))-dimethyltransferase [Candidatus Bathyarchaeota archaeon]|nr:tRNA (guanine(10)-N(2))-dimethyltransferase [Candidatus Bathyarchaeota archaeon]
MKKVSFRINFPTEIVEEGEIKILVPKLKAFVKSTSEYAPSKAPVFYNPIMELNRDMAVLALQAYQRMLNHEISVCEPLTGCGVRGIRFAKEVKGAKKVLINDINEKAFQLARYNVQMNQLSERVTVKNEDANAILGCYGAPRKRFDVIDIDPFGSPVPYLDSSIRALRDGGLLALTATDIAPLCGVHPRACVRKYGGKPLRTEYCHELAVRLLAGCLSVTAAKYEIGVSVVFCHSTDHYIRVYATIKYGAKKADKSIKNMGYVLHCFNCFHREIAEEPFPMGYSGRCSECNSRLSVAGPLWIGKIFDKRFCKLIKEESQGKMFRYRKKIQKILTLAHDEANAPITYYVLDKISRKLALPVPSVKTLFASLREEGFQASLTHFNPRGIRTNASATRMKESFKKVLANRDYLDRSEF